MSCKTDAGDSDTGSIAVVESKFVRQGEDKCFIAVTRSLEWNVKKFVTVILASTHNDSPFLWRIDSNSPYWLQTLNKCELWEIGGTSICPKISLSDRTKEKGQQIFSVESFMQILFSLVSKAKRVKLLHRRKVRTTTRLQDLTLGARKGVIPGY